MLTTDRRPLDLAVPVAPVDHHFAARRRATIERLVRAGIAAEMAGAWIDAWDRSTVGLEDFRHAPDYWEQGFRFALDEYRRGYRPWTAL